MSKFITVHNTETGEIFERNLSEAEIQSLEQIESKNKEEEEKRIQRAADKTALLERLGITEEEAKLLLS